MAATKTPRRLSVEYQPLDQVKPARRNPKRHDLDTIRASILRHGVADVAGIIDERDGRLVAGHGRLTVLADLHAEGRKPPDGIHLADDGTWLVPILHGTRWRNATEAEAFLLGHNRSTELGGWHRDDLQAVLADHRDRLDGTGYTLRDLTPPPIDDDPDPDPTPAKGDPITEPGDTWHLGPHVLTCGSCLNLQTIVDLVGIGTVNLATTAVTLGVTSPPYADRRKYDETTEFRPIPPDEYVEWFTPLPTNIAQVLAPDGSWVVNIKPGADGLDRDLYVYDLVLAHVRQWGWHLADEYCWERSGVPKAPTRRLKNGWEPVYQFTRGDWKWRPDAVRHESDAVVIPIGEGAGDTGWADRQGTGGDLFARNRQAAAAKRAPSNADRQGTVGDEWFADRNEPGLAYPSNRLPTFAGSHEATGHPAAYPIGLPEFFIRLLTDPGDVVLDPFAGSGSTIIAAHRTGRVGLGVELSPHYTDIALARIQHHTGHRPTRNGKAHDLLAHTGWKPARGSDD